MHSLLTTPFHSEAANRYYCSHQGENKGTISSLQNPSTEIHEAGGMCFSETTIRRKSFLRNINFNLTVEVT